MAALLFLAMWVKTSVFGMSGGIAYILPTDEAAFKAQCNMEMIEFERLQHKGEIESVRQFIIKHLEETDSSLAARMY